jgi:tetrahydromethanopterin S-methyltransferase subunit E
MNSQTLGLRLAGIIFGLVCLAHLWRLVAHTNVMIGHHHVPMWPSVLGLIVAGVMSIWMFRLSAARAS